MAYTRKNSLRLTPYDYCRAGMYFITVCVHGRLCLFGDVVDGEMILNDAGQMIHERWWAMTDHFSIECPSFVVMPNHIHGVIQIVLPDDYPGAHMGPPLRGTNYCRGGPVCPPGVGACPPDVVSRPPDTGLCPPNRVGVPKMIQWFKTMSTNEYIQNVHQNDWPPFDKKLWQRGYYDHIVRDENDLKRITKYIDQNPMKWKIDKNHPKYM